VRVSVNYMATDDVRMTVHCHTATKPPVLRVIYMELDKTLTSLSIVLFENDISVVKL
jgi:hypothetical protein